VRRSRDLEPVTVSEQPPRAGIATKVLFAPVKLVAKRVAPRLSSRLFERVWRIVGNGAPPPRSEDPQDSVVKLGLALALEGACRAMVGGIVDHVSRREFARLTGRWPGRKRKT
jgi:Protein of unknown function (DUF4235)